MGSTNCGHTTIGMELLKFGAYSYSKKMKIRSRTADIKLLIFSGYSQYEWNLVSLKRLAYSLYGSVASLSSPGSMATWHVAPLRFAPAFRTLGACEHS